MTSFEQLQFVIISSIDWDSAWQRHQIFAWQLAAAGHDVFFIENSGFRDPGLADLPRLGRRLASLARPRGAAPDGARGLRTIPPRVLPPTLPLFRKVNNSVLIPQLLEDLWKQGLRPHPAVICYFATPTSLELQRRLSPALLVYDCASNFRAHPAAPADFLERERELLDASDLVVCDSDFLFEQKKAEHPRVVQIHQGVAPEFFSAAPARTPPTRLCYYGTWSKDLRPDLVSALAEAGFEVTVSGFVKGAAPALPASVRRLAPVPREELPRRLQDFDAFLMPYVISPFHLGVVPAKIYECLAMGRPVLATPLPSLKALAGPLYVSDDPVEWVRIARGWPVTETEERRRGRVELASDHTHAKEFDRLTDHIHRAWDSARAAPQIRADPSPASERLLGSFLQGFTWIGLFYGTAKVAVLATQVLAGRLLGPTEYGQANVAVALAAFGQILPTLGLPIALAKFLAEESREEGRRRIVSTALTSFAAWAGLLLAAALLGRGALADSLGLDAPLLDLALLYSFANAAYVAVSSPLLGLRRFRERGLSETIYGLSAPALLLGLWAAGVRTHPALVAALAAAFALGSLNSAWSLRGLLRPGFDASVFGPLARYSGLAALNLLTLACIVAPARLILNRHLGAPAVGVFSAYFTSTVQISLSVLYILTAVLIPVSSSREDQGPAWHAYRRMRGPVAAAAFAGLALACASALALFGRRYPLEPAWLILFAAAGSLVLAHGIAADLYAARDWRGLRISVAGSIAAGTANILLCLIFIPRWGIGGAAASLLGAYGAGLAVYAVIGEPGTFRGHARC